MAGDKLGKYAASIFYSVLRRAGGIIRGVFSFLATYSFFLCAVLAKC